MQELNKNNQWKRINYLETNIYMGTAPMTNVAFQVIGLSLDFLNKWSLVNRPRIWKFL